MPCERVNRLKARPGSPAIAGFAAIILILAVSAGTTACNSTMQSMTSQPSNATGSHSKVPLPGSTKIQITPATASVASGKQLQLDAVFINSRGMPVIWKASAGQITASGLFTAPTVTANKTITITASGLLTEGETSAVITVLAPATNTRLAIATTSMPAGTAGASYATTLAGSGGNQPYHWALASGSLPAGLQLSATTGAITGTASKGGTFTFSVQVADASGNTAVETFTLDMSANAQEGSNCGPPLYNCSRSDLQVVIPKAPPQLGSNSGYRGGHLGAGIVAIDPAYNNRMLRVTDGNTDSKQPGASYSVGSSAEKNVTSYDETMFLVHNGSGEVCFYEFDKTNFSARFHGCRNDVGSGDFGYTENDNHVFYGYYHQKLYRWVIDASNWSISADPTFNNGQGFFDPDSANCMNGLIASNKWYIGDSGLSSDDETVIAAVGPTQDANPYYVVWNATNGCQWMNVKNWTVSHGWNTGLSNPAPVQFASGVTPKQQGGIHNAQIDRSGTFGVLTIHNVPSLQQKLFWTIGTPKVDDTCVHCMSHWACDFGVCFWEMGAGVNTGYNLVSQEIGKLSPIENMDTSAVQGQWGDDEHISHANAEPGQKLIYLAAWQAGKGSSVVTTTWDDELVGVNWDGMQRTVRFNKHWTTGYGGFNGSARCSISRQGNYALCGSDYEMYNLDKGFGNGKNQDTCDHNLQSGLIGTNGCRTDVLLFELR